MVARINRIVVFQSLCCNYVGDDLPLRVPQFLLLRDGLGNPWLSLEGIDTKLIVISGPAVLRVVGQALSSSPAKWG